MDRRTASSTTSSRRRLAIGGLLIAVAALGYGCFERSLKPVNPCTTSVQGQVIQVTSVDKVDLLLMIDNSNSMTEEQQSVVQEIPRIVTILTSGHDATGVIPDFTPAHSLHVGLIDCDMGLGDVTMIPTCDTGFGDDGLMQIRARHMGTGCSSDYSAMYASTPNVFDFEVGGATTAAQFGMDVGCVGAFGTDGCGFEFELEAPLKALSLTPTATGDSPVAWTHAGYQPPTFWGSTYGHGDDPNTNGAFLRRDSALAIVTINDEDDSSTGNPHIFSRTDPDYGMYPLNLRGHPYGADQLYDVSRYTQGFIGLRQNPALLIYGAITGIPQATSGLDPAVILADPAMVETMDPASMGDALLPSCISPNNRGVAYPAIRMTQLAQQLNAAGAATTVQSICTTDFGPAFSEIIRIVSQALSGACLARALNPDADGNVSCDVLEALPIIGSGTGHERCADLMAISPGAYSLDHVETITTAGGDTQMREVCRVHQVGRAGAGIEPGWAYDDGNAGLMAGWSALPMGCTQRVGFSVISPENGAEVRLQCDETILPSSHAAAQLGTACTPGSTTPVDCTTGTAVAGNPATLQCDPFDRSCEIHCANDSDCTSAGLLSYVCDHRTALDYFTVVPTSGGINDTDIHNFCVNPTCGQAITQ